jgi:DNA invertase Pin-like site-specific DNA recombinase
VNLAGYIRVSTEQQVDAYGKDVQRKHIVDWAALVGQTITEWFEEDAVSGKTDGGDRPVLRSILDRADEFDGIVFFDATRIARRSLVQETLLGLIWNTGLKVFTTTAGELEADEDDPTKILIRQILGVIAEFDHRNTVLKLHAARRIKAANGGFAGGTPRFGRSVVGHGKSSEYVVNEEEAQTVLDIQRLRSCGYSFQQIADHLNRNRILTKRSKQWYPTTVKRTLEAYDGSRTQG